MNAGPSRNDQQRERGKGHYSGKGGPKRKGAQASSPSKARGRPKPRVADPDSPFAALGDLKKQLDRKKK